MKSGLREGFLIHKKGYFSGRSFRTKVVAADENRQKLLLTRKMCFQGSSASKSNKIGSFSSSTSSATTCCFNVRGLLLFSPGTKAVESLLRSECQQRRLNWI